MAQQLHNLKYSICIAKMNMLLILVILEFHFTVAKRLKLDSFSKSFYATWSAQNLLTVKNAIMSLELSLIL